jgi:hypothetical protein
VAVSWDIAATPPPSSGFSTTMSGGAQIQQIIYRHDTALDGKEKEEALAPSAAFTSILPARDIRRSGLARCGQGRCLEISRSGSIIFQFGARFLPSGLTRYSFKARMSAPIWIAGLRMVGGWRPSCGAMWLPDMLSWYWAIPRELASKLGHNLNQIDQWWWRNFKI